MLKIIPLIAAFAVAGCRVHQAHVVFGSSETAHNVYRIVPTGSQPYQFTGDLICESTGQAFGLNPNFEEQFSVFRENSGCTVFTVCVYHNILAGHYPYFTQMIRGTNEFDAIAQLGETITFTKQRRFTPVEVAAFDELAQNSVAWASAWKGFSHD
jgi:hypothetical protein